jgi:hypothetical protein
VLNDGTARGEELGDLQPMAVSNTALGAQQAHRQLKIFQSAEEQVAGALDECGIALAPVFVFKEDVA